jgi:sodium/bile acid cotransporter 3/5
MSNHIQRMNCSIVLLISQPQRIRDKIFRKGIPLVIMIISIQMGILLDMEVLKELIRRPIQVLIGFVCQYGFMPLIAFAISKIFRYQPTYGLGLFVVGCCPGGSQSNQWTVMFDGDLNLSAFMSFVSTVASFFMMPFWLYTLGQYAYLREMKIHIPFFNLAISLLTIIGPLAIGMIAVYFIPKLKPIIQRIVKPMLLALILYFFVFGAFVNYYLFLYLDLQTALTAPFLPWLGFLFGSLFAWICKQDRKRLITIGIETGKQILRHFLKSFRLFKGFKTSVLPC